ncbi:hypothetical protein PMG11_03325 [Penicillium brasilianum]|uniref:Uncharacterized protein n=1 Tax=Penicillium brasilianum TaxID=104259 RepID=A0A0F7V9U8_PENBI|nr:hypothetical protein PMG11_03325 [Penicillium brasilianum]
MTANISKEPFSAARQVLSSPLLLECIFTWISKDIYGWWPVPETQKNPPRGNPDLPHDDDDDDDDDDEPGEYIGSGGVLMRCATVNKTWFHETTRILWRNWEERTLYGSVMTETFLKIEPDRRQFYANMIHRAEVILIGDQRLCRLARTVFEDITFPNLKTVQLAVPRHGRDRVEIPLFHAPRLKALVIDPEFEPKPVSYSVGQAQWMMVFGIITDRFPSIENMEFLDQAKVWPGEIQKLKDRLHCLKILNVTGVVESTVPGRGL